MSVLVALHDRTDGEDPIFLGRTFADFTKGLPELPKAETTRSSNTIGKRLSWAGLRARLSYIHPRFDGGRPACYPAPSRKRKANPLPYDGGAWLSIALCLRDGNVPLLDDQEHDWIALIEEWSSGALWFEHTGERSDVSDRYPVQGIAARLQGEARTSGRATSVATIIDFAADGGCPLPPDDEPHSVRDETVLARLQVEAINSAPQEPAPEEEEPTAAEWVGAINKKYAIVRHGGEALVARSETDPQTSFEKISFMNVSAFQTLHRNKYVRSRISTDENGDEKKEARRNAGKVWLDSPDRREYPDGVVFAPGKQLPPTFLNLYRGWHVTPAKGNWSLLQDHIRMVICQGDETLNAYVLGWLASAVRNLDTPLGVALVLRGGQGVGKGILGRGVGHLFGPHFVQLAKADQILGRFNAALRDALLVFGDEAFYAADPRHDGALKALITEPLIAIEEKFRDPLMRANSIRLLLATNNDWAVPADADDRRFAVLDVGSARRGDKAYFAAIYDQLKHEGYGAMLYDLLERDLGDFDVRDIPDTKARAEQKTNSLKGPAAWLHDVLQRGRIGLRPWEESGCLVDKGEAYRLYTDWSQQQREYRPATLAAFGRAISRALGAAVRSTRYRTEDHISGPRQFEFSSLIQCRAAFTAYLKTDQPIWEDTSNED